MSACDTCAFRQGCETHDSEPYNRLKAMICAKAGIPFFCHHGFEWQDTQIFEINRRFVTIGGSGTPQHVCAGWKRQVAKFKEDGWFPRDPEQRRVQLQVGRAALTLMRRFVEALAGSKEKDEAYIDLKICVVMLFRVAEEDRR